jgi:hypothetical protein
MIPRSLAAAILCASVLALAAPALADPAYLPPFLERAPALGDRWVYAAYSFLEDLVGQVTVEVVEVEETAGGWRYLVEDQLELLPEVASAGALPCAATSASSTRTARSRAAKSGCTACSRWTCASRWS